MRPLPSTGAAFLSVRDADKGAIAPVARALAELGFALLATAGTAAVVAEAGLQVTTLAKGDAVVDAIRAGREALSLALTRYRLIDKVQLLKKQSPKASDI